MSTDGKTIKDQRDRFLAFSFASADLFLEISEKGEVVYTLGAARSLTGIDEKSLMNRNWLDLFSAQDHMHLKRLETMARPAQRCGPLQVTLDETIGQGRSAIVTAIKMPGSAHLYMTIGFLTGLMARLADIGKHQEALSLLDKDGFLPAAKEALDMARSMGHNADMTLLEIPDCRDLRQKMGQEWWENFSRDLTRILTSNSIDGQAATQLVEGRYGVIHDKSVSPDMLRSQVETLSRQSDPEGKGFAINAKTVSSDLRTLSEREATKALVYTINEFQRKGDAINIDSLNNSFKAYVTANAHKIQQFKSMIETLSFEMFFQPIVSLETAECAHYEMLARFRGEASTQEWVIFGEDIGMAADLDIAVCERALNYIQYKSQGRRTRFAVNISGQSIQSEAFFKNLMNRLGAHKNASERLIFEITESTAIQNLDIVSRFVQILQSENYKVCLDDFGAGAASFQYLQKLPVDYVKIDGQYTRKVLTSERDRVMLRNLAKMCADLGIATVAEQIEQPQQAEIMLEMGIPLGQGYHYAKPSPKPDYAPPAKTP